MKKILSLTLICALLCTLLISCGNSGGSKGFEYKSNGDGTCILVGAGKNEDRDIVIPEKSPDGDTVVAIGNGAFFQNINIETVKIPGTVKTIESGAFALAQLLTDITFTGDGLVTIEDYAFEACYNLTTITIPKTVEKIGKGAFRSCTVLTSAKILSKKVTLADGVFEFCGKLTEVDLGGAVSLGDDTFAKCKSLQTAVIPNSVKNIGKGTFSECEKLENVTLPDGVRAIPDWTFENCKSLKSFTIPSGVETIGYYAFAHCDTLESISIPSTVILIDENAFSACNALTTVELNRNPELTILAGNSAIEK